MPHLTIEYSANVADHHDIDELVGAAHDSALATGLAPLAGMRTRAARRDHFKVATGEPDFAFIAIHCRIGPGREFDEKRTLIEAIIDGAQAAVGDSPLAIAWSVELTVLDADLRINRNGVAPRLETAAAAPAESSAG